MDFDPHEWLNLIFRWIHVFAGIMWIGQTYFFTWLDGRFAELTEKKTAPGEKELLWMVHSGGFYVVERQKIPKLIPATLHWFRWEAALTWLTGLSLLLLVYYDGGLMVNETMDETTALLVGIASLIGAWPLYLLIWRSPIGNNERIGALVSFLLIMIVSYVLTLYMGGRAAYIHVGAMLGTIMAANVWFTIIPAQRAMVADLNAGREPDVALAHRAKTCSMHNTFMAVPLVFLMISNHFPTVSYGTSWPWLVLPVLVLIGWAAARIVRRA